MRRIIAAVLVCLMLILAGCGGEEQPVYRRLSPEKALEMMTQEHILLDVRTEEEFNLMRLEGAVLIPDYELEARAESELPNKGALILVYCRSGRRSAIAAEELGWLGYTNVYDLGGIIDWPYVTVSGREGG